MTPTDDDLNYGEEQARASEARRQMTANRIVVIAGILGGIIAAWIWL